MYPNTSCQEPDTSPGEQSSCAHNTSEEVVLLTVQVFQNQVQLVVSLEGVVEAHNGRVLEGGRKIDESNQEALK